MQTQLFLLFTETCTNQKSSTYYQQTSNIQRTPIEHQRTPFYSL